MEVSKMASTIQIRVDDDLKSKSDQLFKDLGTDTTSAIRMFLTQAVAYNGFPFEIKRTVHNPYTWNERNPCWWSRSKRQKKHIMNPSNHYQWNGSKALFFHEWKSVYTSAGFFIMLVQKITGCLEIVNPDGLQQTLVCPYCSASVIRGIWIRCIWHSEAFQHLRLTVQSD